jgi:hypothetical protein
MNDLLRGFIVLVTGEAQFAGRFLDQLLFRVGLVRIVTGHAASLGYWTVHDGSRILGLVTQITESLTLRRQFEIVGWRFGWVSSLTASVADGALTDPHRPVNKLRFPHVLVTLSGNAPVSVGCVPIEHGKNQHKRDGYQENCR